MDAELRKSGLGLSVDVRQILISVYNSQNRFVGTARNSLKLENRYEKKKG